jgi:hypothetical protein
VAVTSFARSGTYAAGSANVRCTSGGSWIAGGCWADACVNNKPASRAGANVRLNLVFMRDPSEWPPL